MTAPVVGQVAVEVLAEAKALAKSLRKEVESAFKDLDLGKLLRSSVGKNPIAVPVTPDFDEESLPKRLPGKNPRVPVELDPLFAAFQQEIKRQTAALAREVNLKVPVDGDVTGLRAELGSQLQAVSAQLRVKVPAEPGERAKFESALQAQLAEVAARIKAHVGVEPDTSAIPEKVRQTRVPKVSVEVDPLMNAFQQQVRRQVAKLSRQVEVNIPLTAQGSELRGELAAQLKAIQAQSRIQVPTEPEGKARYEAKLRAQLAEVAQRVRQTVHVDVDKSSGLSGISSFLKGLGNLPGLGTVASGLADITGAIQKAAGSSAQLGGSLAGAFESATGPIGLVIGALVAVGGAATAAFAGIAGGVAVAIPAVTALAGVIAAIPGALTGLGAAVGTLALGFKGIGEAFKPKTGGGGGAGSAVNQARQIAAASRQVEAARRGIAAANRNLEQSERGLAAAERGVLAAERAYADAQNRVVEAQKRAVLAQQAINRARVEAREDIEDLNRSLRGAALSEEDATLSVEEALRSLNEVKLTGNIPDIQRADLAYRQALQTLDEARDTTDDLQQATDEANSKGVEGSDKVQQALRDQQEALKGVQDAQQGVLEAQNGILDAQDALKSAQDGVLSAQDGIKSATDGLASAQDSLAQAQQKVAAGGGAATKAVTKLAPAAQKFVDAIKSLKPAFESLRLDVQQRLFDGLDKTVTHLGDAWIPALKVTLGSYADTFNQFFKNLGTAVTTPKFISDIQTGAEGFRQLVEKIGEAITSKLLPAFGSLAAASGPFLSKLGDELANVLTTFSDWVLQGEKTGGLERFFDKAAQAMHDIFDIGGSVASIIGSIFAILTGASPGAGDKNPLQQFKEGLDKVAAYLGDPANQKKIENFIGGIRNALAQAITFANQITGIYDRVRSALGGNGANSSLGVDIGAGIVTGVIAGIGFQSQLLLDTIKGLFFTVIAHTQNLLGIHSPSTVFAEIGANIMQGLINGATSLLGNVASTIARVPGIATRAVAGAATWLLSAGRNTVTGLINGIAANLGSLGTYAGNLRVRVVNATTTAASWLAAAGRNAVTGLINGIGAMLGSLGKFAGNARVYVVNAAVSAGSWLYNAGRAVISGLMSGISSMLGSLGSFLGSVGSFIQAHKGPLDKDRQLLVGAGQAIMGGLITGIADRKAALAAELSNVTGMVRSTDLPSLGLDSGQAISRSLSVADQGSMQLSWRPGSSGDQLLDAIASLVDLRYRGDVQAALSRT